jgi:predicted Zn-dependent protease
MKRIIFLWLISFFFFATPAMAELPCGILPSQFPQPELNIFDYSHDKKLDKQSVEALKRILRRTVKNSSVPNGTELIHDAQINAYISRMVQTILRYAPDYAKKINYKVYVFSDDRIIAEAYPAGSMGVSLGFFTKAKSDDDIAFILAHEMSHAALRHMTRFETLEQLYEMEKDILEESFNRASGSDARNIHALLRDVRSRTEMLKAKRVAQELEADHFSSVIGVKAGFNPINIAQKHLKDSLKQKRGRIGANTHPHYYMRYLMYACSTPSGHYSTRSSGEFEQIQRKAKKLLKRYGY